MILRLITLVLFIMAIGCYQENELVVPEQMDAEDNYLKVSELNYVKRSAIRDFDTSFVRIFIFDHEGKVLEEIHKNHTFVLTNYESEFEYNEDGKVIKEVRNGELYRYINWTNNMAEVYDGQDNKVNEFIFKNDRIWKNIYYGSAKTITYTVEYDLAGNAVSIMDDSVTGVAVEFLEFRKNIESPFHLLRSIDVLRFHDRPYIKHIYNVEKQNPYVGTDFSVSLKYYDLVYKLDLIDRVTRIENERHFIYVEEFGYK